MSMKKIVLTLVAALIAVVSYAQATKQFVSMTNARLADPVKTLQMKPIHKNLQAPASKFLAKKAPFKAGEAFNIEDLNGEYMMVNSSYSFDDESEKLVPNEPAQEATPIEIVVTGANTFSIYGIGGYDKPVNATIDLTTGEITIPANQVVGVHSTLGDITMENATSEGDFTAVLYQGNIMVIQQLWFMSIVYQGQPTRATDYYGTVIFPVNGTMSYVDSKEQEVVANVYVEQDEETKNVTVYNFGDFECAVEFELAADKTFSVDYNQVVVNGGSNGLYSPYALTADGKNLDIIVGAGTATTLTTQQDWTLYSSKGYWYGQQKPFTVELIDGSEFEYPEQEIGVLVEAPAGLVTAEFPFMATLYDLDGSKNPDFTSTVKVGWDNTDVYIQGLDKYLPEAWVKGAYDAEKGKVEIPVTYMGIYENAVHYFAAYGDKPDTLTLNYDADSKTFDYGATVMIYKGTNTSAYAYFYNGLIIGQKPVPVTPPTELSTIELPMWAKAYVDDSDEATDVTGTVRVGFDGQDVYIQDLFGTEVPGGWVKGTITEVESKKYVVFEKNQYVGDLKNGLSAYLTGYVNGEDGKGTVGNVLMSYNETDQTFLFMNSIILTRFKNSLRYETIYVNLTIGNMPEGISNVNNDAKATNVWYSINGVRVAQPTQKGLYIRNGKKYLVK